MRSRAMPKWHTCRGRRGEYREHRTGIHYPRVYVPIVAIRWRPPCALRTFSMLDTALLLMIAMAPPRVSAALSSK